jgi:hypothetical protein
MRPANQGDWTVLGELGEIFAVPAEPYSGRHLDLGSRTSDLRREFHARELPSTIRTATGPCHTAACMLMPMCGRCVMSGSAPRKANPGT